jgi:hypothetical protein
LIRGGFSLKKIPKDYIQVNREMNQRILGTASREWGSGPKLYFRGVLYLGGTILVGYYGVPFVWNYVSALIQ